MKKYFLAGLVTLLPLAVTFWVIAFIIQFLTTPFLGIVTAFLNSFPGFVGNVPTGLELLISKALILIFLFLLIFLLGFVARRFFFHQILLLGDKILYKIPLVNKVYKTSKEIVHSFFNTTQQSFKQVVLLHFPYKGCYSLGLIASDAPAAASKSIEEEMVSVFILTTPNPTTGYLVMSRKSDLIFLKMKSEDAIKYVVSCAVILPEPIQRASS
ncbi:MAG TPA: DUF502 domain-containing protein [Chlamydiales bacterium]|nr:DUF502 domain-containing protein [Chlamydiales bacterium]